MEGKEVQYCTMMPSNAEAHPHDMTLTPTTETLPGFKHCVHIQCLNTGKELLRAQYLHQTALRLFTTYLTSYITSTQTD